MVGGQLGGQKQDTNGGARAARRQQTKQVATYYTLSSGLGQNPGQILLLDVAVQPHPCELACRSASRSPRSHRPLPAPHLPGG